MQALAVFPDRRSIQLIDCAPPKYLGPGEVRVRILEVGLAAADHEIGAFRLGRPPAGSSYLIPGHESIGEVIEVGLDVEDLQTGDLVVPVVRRPCPNPGCRACRSGRLDLCRTGDWIDFGIRGAHGFLREEVVEEADAFVALPRALRNSGVLAAPLARIQGLLAQVMDLQSRIPWACMAAPPEHPSCERSALVLGADCSGALAAMSLAAFGYETTLLGEPAQIAGIGAAVGEMQGIRLAPLDEGWPPEAEADLVYFASGSAAMALAALDRLARHGIFVFGGELEAARGAEGPNAFALLARLAERGQAMISALSAPREAYHWAAGSLENFGHLWRGAPDRLITARHPIEAHLPLLRGEIPGAKHVIRLA